MRLSALYRYPLKSAIAEPLTASAVDPLGLCGDRRWMLVDEASGRFLTQRNDTRMSQLSALYAGDGGLILNAPGHTTLAVPRPGPDQDLRGVTIWGDSFRVPDAGESAAAWTSEFIGKSTRLVYVPEHRTRTFKSGLGLSGDRVAFADGFPLLLIGEASLQDLSGKVGRPLEMLRFRPNLVIEGGEAFAEDDWRRIRIGGVDFRHISACARCILTTADPRTGERSADREPLMTLARYRKREGGVMFGQNLVADGAGHLEIGMPVEVLE
jgi:uncharacterized protein YcbX